MRSILLMVALLAGCAHPQLTPEQAARLAQPADRFGARIYVGTVTPEGERAPVFRYERRVRHNADGTRVATHVTWLDDSPVVVQEATQDAAGRLLAYDEVHGQRGETYHLDGGDVIVGPTLFEFLRANLPKLRAGRTVRFDFWDKGSTYAFVLEWKATAVEMRAANALVGLAIAPMQFRLGKNDEVVAYHGRIPPLHRGRSVDAETTYTYDAAFR